MSDWLYADDLIRMIDEIVSNSKLKALDHNGHTHFYSTPSDDVINQIAGVIINNHARALRRAPRLGATLIDDTLIGQFLSNFRGTGSAIISKKGTFDYFLANPLISADDKYYQAVAPWKHASRYFALASWGYVSTTICGASRDSVYYTLETPYAVNPYHPTPSDMQPIHDDLEALFVPRVKPVEFINLLPFDRVAKGYTPTKWERAHRIIGLGEQRMTLNEALDGVNPRTIGEGLRKASVEVLSRPIEVFQYYLESRECYLVDRHLMLKSAATKPKKSDIGTPQERQIKREREATEFGLMALQLVKTELELLPPADRPNIPAFSIIGGKVTFAV